MDFNENMRPLRVLSGLHCLVNHSDLYRNSDKATDDEWFQEITESAEDTVREFFEVAAEQTKNRG